MFTLRPARETDRAALYRICLETGASGQDATHLYTDPLILGHVYAGPYLTHAPGFAFVLEDQGSGEVTGYVLGVPDTAAFEATLDREWWPPLRELYPDPAGVPRADRTPDERIAHLIHWPPRAPQAVLTGYPAHLHIDLLPAAQGGGQGRALMTTLLDALRGAGARGVHLGVGESNTRAQGFYQHLGFRELSRAPGAVTYGLTLTAPS
ncbi:GNAT family N-acetyltransferase [Deinococcus soli (ex Cha et al. 2016)]|uniref:Acetyltransferase n=1 Tax=Deinococcus soli (ex Cha et al. 2016) TaxID=1309411 RepID=A0A0F7JN74_9DEIO|nr:GNAT family N-acetyltransferase [Deinococcus soli (ex Cha et al. 2016)]AKH16318.1 acetyltransferase [Deinococcus soli (ex Cha et al. 2016)]